MAFDVTEWINSKLGSALDEKAIKSIKDFSLVWNIFEDRACDNNPSVTTLLPRRVSCGRRTSLV
jgi:hypothetical protein